MSMMAPNGAALLSGMQSGMQIRRYNDSLEMQQQRMDRSAGTGLVSEELAISKAYDEDMAELAKMYAEARPGDEELLEFERQSRAERWGKRGFKVPEPGLFTGMRGAGGFGNRADSGKYFESREDELNNQLGSQIENHIASIPVDQLLTPEGLAANEKALVGSLTEAGLSTRYVDTYLKRLRARVPEAEARINQARGVIQDRQMYVTKEMSIIDDRLKEAYPAPGTGFMGAPLGRIDPGKIAEKNIIMAAARTLISEGYSKGIYLTAEDAITQLRQMFPEVKSIQQAVGTMIKGASGVAYTPRPAAIPGAPAYQESQGPWAPPKGAGEGAQEAAGQGDSVSYTEGTDTAGAKWYTVQYKGQTYLLDQAKFDEFRKTYLTAGSN